MSEISAMASSAMAMNQSNQQQQIETSLLRMKAQADKEMAEMIMQNAKQIQELTQKSSGGIDLFV
jgi:hypothetical protein